MPRQRTSTIAEGTHLLEWHLNRHKGTPAEGRLLGLKYLKENPHASFEEISEISGFSARSLRRWYALYRSGGIDGVIGETEGRPGRRTRLSREELNSLQERMHRGDLHDLEEIRMWILEEFGVEYSIKGISNILRTKLDLTRTWRPTTVGAARTGHAIPAVVSDPNPAPISPAIINFLNSLPITSNTVEWITAFRDGLQRLLGDVDRITITVNTECDLHNPGSIPANLSVMQFFQAGEKSTGRVSVASQHEQGGRASQMIENLRWRGFTRELYHDPHPYEYYFGGIEYIGLVILWRERANPPIRSETLAVMAVIEPFLIFMLSDLVARHQQAKPGDRTFNEALGMMSQEARLTEQERRVVILQLFGHSYQDIADRLHLSLDTVRKHVKSIYRKTGTGSYTELFAKYFTPRLGF